MTTAGGTAASLVSWLTMFTIKSLPKAALIDTTAVVAAGPSLSVIVVAPVTSRLNVSRMAESATVTSSSPLACPAAKATIFAHLVAVHDEVLNRRQVDVDRSRAGRDRHLQFFARCPGRRRFPARPAGRRWRRWVRPSTPGPLTPMTYVPGVANVYSKNESR